MMSIVSSCVSSMFSPVPAKGALNHSSKLRTLCDHMPNKGGGNTLFALCPKSNHSAHTHTHTHLENLWEEKVEECPELWKIVLQRCAGEEQATLALVVL